MAQTRGNQYFPEEHFQEGCSFTGPIVPPWDDNARYIPLFATCQVPEDYLRALFNYAKIDGCSIRPVPTVEDDSKVLGAIENCTGEELTTTKNFETWSRANCWAYYEKYIRPTEDPASQESTSASSSTQASPHFSFFTIAVIDSDCFDPSEPALKICTTAPDQKDDLDDLLWQPTNPGDPLPADFEPRFPKERLKSLKTRLDQASSWLNSIESLTSTYTELADNREFHVSIIPPAWVDPATGKFASPALARRRKLMELAHAVEEDREEARQNATA